MMLEIKVLKCPGDSDKQCSPQIVLVALNFSKNILIINDFLMLNYVFIGYEFKITSVYNLHFVNKLYRRRYGTFI